MIVNSQSQEHERETRVVVIGNQKGGVAKTTTTIHLAAALCKLGRKCLLIDLDSTARATKWLKAPTEGWPSSFEFITGDEDPEGCVIDGSDDEVQLPENFHLIPGSLKLNELERWLLEDERRQWTAPQDILLPGTAALRGKYDYIFFDTPPNVTKTTTPSIKASDFAVLCGMADQDSIDAIGDALRQIHTAREYGGANVQLLGILLSSIPRPVTRLSQHLINSVSKSCVDAEGNSLKFSTDIGRSVAIQEARRANQTIFDYKPDHVCAEQYLAVANEFEDRIERFLASSQHLRQSSEEMGGIERSTVNG